MVRAPEVPPPRASLSPTPALRLQSTLRNAVPTVLPSRFRPVKRWIRPGLSKVRLRERSARARSRALEFVELSEPFEASSTMSSISSRTPTCEEKIPSTTLMRLTTALAVFAPWIATNWVSATTTRRSASVGGAEAAPKVWSSSWSAEKEALGFAAAEAAPQATGVVASTSSRRYTTFVAGVVVRASAPATSAIGSTRKSSVPSQTAPAQLPSSSVSRTHEPGAPSTVPSSTRKRGSSAATPSGATSARSRSLRRSESAKRRPCASKSSRSGGGRGAEGLRADRSAVAAPVAIGSSAS